MVLAMTAMKVGICRNCLKETLVGPLHGDKGGPIFCIACGTDWHAKYNRRRKIGRIIIKAMKAYTEAGGNPDEFKIMQLAAYGVGFGCWEADTIGRDIGDITTELLEATIRLTHPDRHPPEREDDARRVTQELLALKPYTFPAPKPKPVAPYVQERKIKPFTETFKKPSRPSYPCELCADTVPFNYCNACRARWVEIQQQKREAIRAKRRLQYARRKARVWVENHHCQFCGKEFNDKRKDAKFCSSACRQRAHRGRVTDTATLHEQPLDIRNEARPPRALFVLNRTKRNLM